MRESNFKAIQHNQNYGASTVWTIWSSIHMETNSVQVKSGSMAVSCTDEIRKHNAPNPQSHLLYW